MKLTIIFEFEGLTYNQYSIAVPRIGEKILINQFGQSLIVTSVTYDLDRDIVYLNVQE